MLYSKTFTSEIGNLKVTADNEAVVGVSIVNKLIFNKSNNIIDLAIEQLKEYFNKKRKIFTFPIKFIGGTNFQLSVWNELKKINYGSTLTYGEIAKKINNPRAGRAVGMACNKNPLLIVVPCHRVIGRNGSLTGFAGGLDLKKYLLELEKL